MTLQGLPFDIYVHILEQLPVAAHSEDSPRTLAACLQTNSTLSSAASVATLWEPHYRARYTVCDVAKECSRAQALGDDWKARFMERIRLDRQVIKILDGIVMERDGRLERAREVTSTFSYDVWNALVTVARCNVPEDFRDDDEGESEERTSDVPPHAIPRRFWAQSLLGAISRSHAVRVWTRLKLDGENNGDGLETAIACLSAYFSHPPVEISSQLDLLSDQCRSYLVKNELPVDPDEFNRSEDTLSRISSSICDFLWENGFRAAGNSRFHIFNTQFPHWFLTTHKDTIPLSLVYIFVCIARKLGMAAAPIDFPARVLAIVSSPDPTVSDIFVDVFGSRSRAILSTQEDIPRLLIHAGITPSSMVHYIRPASTMSMVVRASRNILASFSAINEVSEGDARIAFYVALTVNLIFLTGPQYLLNIMKHIGRFPLDILSVLTDVLAPCLNPTIKHQLLASCKAAHEDEVEAAASVMLRSDLPIPIKYFVGLIFRHSKYEYIGYIYGWEPSCTASESWINSMNVDSLRRGRHQPFYHIFTQDGSLRYVAEENIQPVTLKPYAYCRLFKHAHEAGRYFEGLVEENGRARLLLSPELLAAYPEDNAVGERWIREGAPADSEDALPSSSSRQV
ncbi:YccV-like-domain-containing protein [Paxillus ammoniavirescens]|nr:YccV-like-domain-containing protein [Paxillus ammoniavirescens]